MSWLLFSTSLNPQEIGSNASEGIDLLVRQRGEKKATKKQKLPSSMSLDRLPAGVAQAKGVSSPLKDLD